MEHSIRRRTALARLDGMDIKRFFARSNRSLEDSVGENWPAFFAGYGLIGGILVFGGLGFLVDRWAGTSPWFVLAGIAIGVAISGFGAFRSSRTTSKGR
jgi:F0F1-type ATP synthase assembly protein I